MQKAVTRGEGERRRRLQKIRGRPPCTIWGPCCDNGCCFPRAIQTKTNANKYVFTPTVMLHRDKQSTDLHKNMLPKSQTNMALLPNT